MISLCCWSRAKVTRSNIYNFYKRFFVEQSSWCFPTKSEGDLPVGHYTRVVTLLVLVHLYIAHQNKGSVSVVGSDYASTGDGLGEMGVYGRAADRLQALQLPRRGNIKSLQASRKERDKHGVTT